MLLAAVGLAFPASAAPIGRHVAAERQWAVGGIVSLDEIPFEDISRNADLNSDMFLGEASFGYAPNWDAFLRFGVSSDRYQAGPAVTQDIGTKLSWGLGIRGVAYESYSGWRLLGDLQYYSRPARHWMGADIDIREIQAEGALEIKVGDFYPYAGLGVGRVELNSNNKNVFPAVKNKHSVLVNLGLGFEWNPRWPGFVEAHLINGPSVSFGLAHRF